MNLKLKHLAPLALVFFAPLAFADANHCDIAVNVENADVALVPVDAVQTASTAVVVSDAIRCDTNASLQDGRTRAKVRSALIDRWQALDLNDPTAELIRRALFEMNRADGERTSS